MGFTTNTSGNVSEFNSATLSSVGFNFNSGTVVSSTNKQIYLDTNSSSIDDEYKNSIIEIVSGVGKETIREIVGYDGTGKFVTVPTLGKVPTNSKYVIHRHSGVVPVQDQVDRRVTVKLSDHISTINNFFKKQLIRIIHKNGENETRFIIDYDSSNKTITVSEKWMSKPTEGDYFIISGESGLATEATTNTITIDTNHTKSIVSGLVIEIYSGLGSEQVRKITSINSNVVTVDYDWTDIPDNTSCYRIFSGWVGSFEPIDNYSNISYLVNIGSSEKAIVSAVLSTTNGKSGAMYSRKELYYESRNTHTFSAKGRYAKLLVLGMGTSVNGSIQTNLDFSQSNNVTTVENLVTDTTDCSIVRAVLTGRSDDDGRYKNINTDFEGNLNVNIMQPRDNFGHVVTAEPNVMLELKFPYGTTHYLQNYLFTGSSGFIHNRGMLTPTTGTTAGSVARLKSVHRTYDAGGLSMKIRFSAFFSPPAIGCQQIIGYGDENNGYFVGYKGEEFGVMKRSGGCSEIRCVQILTGATSTGNVTVELSGETVQIPVTIGDTVYEIARKIAKGVLIAPIYLQTEYTTIGSSWNVYEDNKTVYFQAEDSGPHDGVYSISGQGVTGVFNQYQAGILSLDKWYLQSTWNVDRTDETVALPVIDFSKGNIYEIDLQWMGFGNIVFKIQNPNTGRFCNIHEIIYSNRHGISNIEVPHQPLMMEVNNGSTTNNVSLSTTSLVSLTIGRDNLYNASRFGSSIIKKQTLQAGKHYNILTLRNNPVLMGTANIIEMMGLTIASSWKGNSSALFSIFINAELEQTLTQVITQAGTGYSNGNKIASTGGTGIGMTFNITTVSGSVTDISIANHGSGYSKDDVLTISGGGGDCTVTLENNGLNWIPRRNNVSAAYICNDYVQITGGEEQLSISMGPGTQIFEKFGDMQIFMPPWYSLTLVMEPLEDEIDAEFSCSFFWSEKI